MGEKKELDGSGSLSLLSLLDSDDDGSVLDDVAGLAGGLLGRFRT